MKAVAKLSREQEAEARLPWISIHLDYSDCLAFICSDYVVDLKPKPFSGYRFRPYQCQNEEHNIIM